MDFTSMDKEKALIKMHAVAFGSNVGEIKIPIRKAWRMLN